MSDLDTTQELFLVFFLESFMQFYLRTTLILCCFDQGLLLHIVHVLKAFLIYLFIDIVSEVRRCSHCGFQFYFPDD